MGGSRQWINGMVNLSLIGSIMLINSLVNQLCVCVRVCVGVGGGEGE